MSKNNWLKSPWIIAIGAAVAGSLASFVLDIVKDKPVFSTIWSWLVWSWNIIIAFLNLDIKVWWLIIGIGIIIFILWIIFNINGERPNFLNYQKGVLKTWEWGWRWERDHFTKKWYVSDLHAYCPKCKTRLMESNSNNPDKCPRCNFYVGFSCYSENKNEIQHLILDNIEKGNYPKNQGK
jgi:hypothetical protein